MADEIGAARNGNARLSRVVEGLVAILAGDPAGIGRKLYAELAELAQLIESAKHEIASVGADAISDRYIPEAQDELDAVIGATEEAAGTILDSAEAIEAACAALTPEAARPIQEAVTHIYEACNFQDITGQRITKVVHTLKQIEGRVHALLGTFAEAGGEMPASMPQPTDGAIGDQALVNGPQLPDAAKDQAEIDAILASFN
jgi:chemotaxis protein CheZ